MSTSFDKMMDEMKKQGISKAEMARRICITDQRFYGWKQRSSIPKTMEAPVAVILDLELLYLKTGEGPKYRSESDSAPVTDIPPDEQALLNKYRRMNAEKKRTMQTISDAFDQPEVDRDTA